MTSDDVAQQYCEMLQEGFANDPAAMHALVCNRVPCNEGLSNHPQIEVDASSAIAGVNTVGVLGIVNGLLRRIGSSKVIQIMFTRDLRPVCLGFRVVDAAEQPMADEAPKE